MVSWQTRGIAMVVAASSMEPRDEILKFAANLTIDNEEYELFNKENPTIETAPKLPVHASTQDAATQKQYEAAADRNSFEMLALFGKGVETTPPGQ